MCGVCVSVCVSVCVCLGKGERERETKRERESTRAYLCQCFILKKYTMRVWKDRTDNIRVNPWVFHSHGRVERWNNRWKYRPEVVSCNCQVILRSYNLQHLRPTVTNRKIFLQIPQALRISSANLVLCFFVDLQFRANPDQFSHSSKLTFPNSFSPTFSSPIAPLPL